MKTMNSFLILLIAALAACNNPKKSSGSNNGIPAPSETGTYNGEKVKMEEQKDTLPRKQPELQVRDVDVQVLGDSTKIGSPGDVLVTFIGQGFVFTEHNPVLRIGREDIDRTYTNETATELYVIVPAKSMNKLMAGMRSQTLSIINPDKKEVRITQPADMMMNKMNAKEKVNLMHTAYGITRKRG